MPVAWQDVLAYYDYLTLHLVAGPRSWSYFVPIVLMYLALLIPPSVLSHNQLRCLLLPLIYAIQIHVWTQHGSFDVISTSGMLTAFMLIGWYDVRSDFKYVKRLTNACTGPRPYESGPRTGDVVVRKGEADSSPRQLPETTAQIPYTVETYPASLSARCRWVTTLFLSLRLTDWHIGVHSHDVNQPCPIKPWGRFVSETVVHTAFCYTLLDATSAYMATTACTIGSPDVSAMFTVTYLMRPAVHLAYFYAALALLNALVPHLIAICVLSVMPSLRYHAMVSPLMWASHFGPVSSIYSSLPRAPVRRLGLRAFWGTFWHQNMRHVASTPGIALAQVLGLPKSSKLRHMTVVTSGFFWSGIIHMGVAPLHPVDTRLTGWQMKILIASFFWLQVVGIGLEDLAEYLSEVYGRRQVCVKVDNTDLKAVDDRGTLKTDTVSSLFKQCAVCLWTVTFLAVTAWWTVFPVGCEMNWWSLKLLPFYASKKLLTRL